MQDILVAVLSLLSTLYWLLVTLKIKKSHYQVYEALLALASSIPLHCLSSGHLHRTSKKGALPQDFATTIPSAWNALLSVTQQTE